ncbi:ubiquitin carboxyl-terminal hydrolase 5 [Centruroides vittatus]|uniref:ubiquitin carboxyl-terminal hydrolase 5 n=1 Tax=Centruroides vittatus TaxID=120091 RepID=UPI003510532B
MATVENLLSHVSKVRIPTNGDRIYKDECVYSFDTPESDTGLYVCLNTFLGLGLKHIERHYHRTGSAIYLLIKRIKREITPQKNESENKKPTKLAIGIEGGFDLNEKKYEFEEFYSVVVLPDFVQIPFPCEDLPEQVQLSINTILASDSAAKIEEAQALSGTWDGEKRKISKHTNSLMQLDNGVKIPPKGWKCQLCDKTDNLWLNLTDGSIMCGRKYQDGTGGNNHAVEHYEKTRYPLVVKLGTITAAGGDVYSYDEDDMVEDPNLARHLAHFGINIAQMEKTDKSMIELEIDLNQRIREWNIIQESGSELTPLYGPGYTGLANLGNSCYLNSVMQMVFCIPDFCRKYYDGAAAIFQNAPLDPSNDFTSQMAKLAHGLLSGEYSKPPPEDSNENKSQIEIRPQMFKNLIGKGHPEFSTKRQQDAQEFFLHLINILERNNRNQENPADCFKYQFEERIQCLQSGKVKYTTRTEYLLSLPIPMNAALNKEKLEEYQLKKLEKEAKGEKIDSSEIVRPFIPLTACIETFAASEMVDDFYSSAINSKSTAQKTTRFRTFPDYLLVQLKKFTIGEDWIPLKLDVCIDIPDIIDLNHLRGKGLQKDEEELPNTVIEPTTPEIQLDPNTIIQLSEMGFPLDACKRAVYKTDNSGMDAALNWIMEHMNDPDYASPFVLPTNLEKESDFVPNPEAVATIAAMGFTEEQAVCALKATENNLERAADWIFSHADELSQTPMETDDNAMPDPKFRDGSGTYRLIGFISHMGTSTMVGHYVCHLLKDGHWVIFNDEKVALSKHPPKEMGYLYLYERI